MLISRNRHRLRVASMLALLVALAGCQAAPTITILPQPQASPTTESTLGAALASVAAEYSVTPTPCSAPLTPAQTEGPYFRPESPERTDLAQDDPTGTALLLTGGVMTAGCVPLADVRIEFWQADGSGNYDNLGFRLRGHQFTDAQGRYRLETVIPGEYPGRAPHIHVKVLAADGLELLTTQLYLTGVSDVVPDDIFDPRLLAADESPEASGRRHVTFDFVVVP